MLIGVGGNQVVDGPILVAPKWDLNFHIHIDASNLVVDVMLVQNPTGKCDQLIWRTPTLLERLKCKSKNENNGRRSWGTLPNSQHFRGRGVW